MWSIPVKKSSEFALEPIMYKIYRGKQWYGNLKGGSLFGWKKNCKSCKYHKCNGCFDNEVSSRGSKSARDSLNNSRLTNFPYLFLHVDFGVFPLMKLLHYYFIVCRFNCIKTRFVTRVLLNQEVSSTLDFVFRSVVADTKSFVWILYVNSWKDGCS